VNPYLALAAVLACIASFIAGSIHGHSAERKSWELVVAEQKITASQVLVGALRRAVEAERKLAAKNSELETAYAQRKDDINAAVAAAVGRVRHDPKGRGICSRDGVPGDSTAGVPADTPSGCELSRETGGNLTKLAGLADLTAAYARSCYEWAKALPSNLLAP